MDCSTSILWDTLAISRLDHTCMPKAIYAQVFVQTVFVFVLLLQDPSHDACLSSVASTRYVAHDCWPNWKYSPHHPCKCNNNLLHTQSCRIIYVHSQDSPTHVLPAHLTIHRTCSARANTHLHSAKWTGSSCWNIWANDQSTCFVNANGQTMLRYRDTWAWFECVAMDYTF